VNTLEQAPRFEELPGFGLETFGVNEDFDINVAFQEAIQGVASDTELALEEKVRRMEVIVNEGKSEVYRDYVDFRQIAAQMEIMCSHDHVFSQSMKGNETLSGLLDSHRTDDGHNHRDSLHGKHNHKKDDDEYDIDPKTGKKTKKKKRTGWFSILMK
jgi:hypothetical protein